MVGVWRKTLVHNFVISWTTSWLPPKSLSWNEGDVFVEALSGTSKEIFVVERINKYTWGASIVKDSITAERSSSAPTVRIAFSTTTNHFFPRCFNTKRVPFLTTWLLNWWRNTFSSSVTSSMVDLVLRRTLVAIFFPSFRADMLRLFSCSIPRTLKTWEDD